MQERLDRIIIVASKAALEPSKEECWLGKTAIDVYEEEINKYLSDKKYKYQYQYLTRVNSIDDNNNTGLPVEIVEFDDGESLNDLMKVVNLDLFNTDNDKDENIHLYVDTQGGYRNWIVQLDALIGILKTYNNVELMGRYAVDYSHDKSSPNRIINVDEFYEMNDLLKGYQNYKRYGVCDDLFDYFIESSKSSVKNMVKNMKEAMEALTLCDMASFDDKVNTVIKAKDDLNINASDSRLNLIFKNILEDLNQLNSEKYSDKILARIKWCKEKGMILQALNIIESEVPKMLSDLKIIKINYNPEGETNGEIIGENDKDNQVDKKSDYNEYKKINKDILNSINKFNTNNYSEEEILLREILFQNSLSELKGV